MRDTVHFPVFLQLDDRWELPSSPSQPAPGSHNSNVIKSVAPTYTYVSYINVRTLHTYNNNNKYVRGSVPSHLPSHPLWSRSAARLHRSWFPFFLSLLKFLFFFLPWLGCNALSAHVLWWPPHQLLCTSNLIVIAGGATPPRDKSRTLSQKKKRKKKRPPPKILNRWWRKLTCENCSPR